jgi:hypothetical protein
LLDVEAVTAYLDDMEQLSRCLAKVSTRHCHGVVATLSHMILVDRYQSIADTFVQLCIYLPLCCDCLIATRFDREMRNDEEIIPGQATDASSLRIENAHS